MERRLSPELLELLRRTVSRHNSAALPFVDACARGDASLAERRALARIVSHEWLAGDYFTDAGEPVSQTSLDFDTIVSTLEFDDGSEGPGAGAKADDFAREWDPGEPRS